MKILGYLNYIIFQWFFTRLARIEDVDSGKIIGYRFIYRIPLTGWVYK